MTTVEKSERENRSGGLSPNIFLCIFPLFIFPVNRLNREEEPKLGNVKGEEIRV